MEGRLERKSRVIVADDHPLFRRGLRQVIEAAPEFEVVLDAGDGGAALRGICELQPDACILDVDMPVLGGTGVVREVRAKGVPTEFIFLTLHKEPDLFRAALEFDVKGYVLKECADADIVQTLRTVLAGRRYVSPGLAELLVRHDQGAAAPGRKKRLMDRLTSAERRVLKLIATRMTSKEIGRQIGVSHRTVENHRANICTKLSLNGAHALVKFAFENRACL